MNSISEKKLFIVIGMHRSGTSAVTRALKVFDIPLGDNFISASEDANPKGYWEDKDINALNVEMMEAINIDWHTLTPIQAAAIDSLRSNGYFSRAESLIQSKFADKFALGMKDPRITKLFPFWQEVFDQGRFNQNYLLALRNPISVAKSLEKRDGFLLGKSIYLWIDHVINSLSCTQAQKRIVIDYDRLLIQPEKEIARVSKYFHLQINQKQLNDYVTEFLDNGLCHALSNQEELLIDDRIPALAAEIYALMLEAASDKFDINQNNFEPTLQRWRNELERIRPAMILIDELTNLQLTAESPLLKNKSKNVIELIQAVALPESAILKSQLCSDWYLQQNRDIAQAGIDPYEHWLAHGLEEARLPAPNHALLARKLISEREQSLRLKVENNELALHQLMQDNLETQKEFSASIKRLEQSLYAKQIEHIELLDATLAKKQHEWQRLSRELVELHKESSARILQLQDTACRERAEFTRQLTQLEKNAKQESDVIKKQYDKTIVELNNQLIKIKSTWIWRLTAPFRKFSEVIRGKISAIESQLNDSIEEDQLQRKRSLLAASLSAEEADVGSAMLIDFNKAADEVPQAEDYLFTRLMHYIWNSRLDLQKVFDIYSKQGQLGFSKWFLLHAYSEYGLPPGAYPNNLLKKLNSFGGELSVKVQAVLDAKQSLRNMIKPLPQAVNGARGVNLVGYAHGEFGMGEHVRMMARALKTTDIRFCILDQDAGLHGTGDKSVDHWVVDAPQYYTNIFNINADVFPLLYFKLGESFYAGRYNIGCWAWELSKCPKLFDLALSMVNEVWAISEFVADSFKTRATVPVITMPHSVAAPALDKTKYTKSFYGLPEDKFVYFFIFDAMSHLERKNPLAVVRAFKRAFPLGTEDAHLLLKTMNTENAGSLWAELLAEIAGDSRITILSKCMNKEAVLGLNIACDAFVSLHRSEGFGFCVAEAMAYGKPVIVTNYSGTRDFAREDTACVVDFRLVPVAEGAYPLWEDQVWAEPDVEHAAELMKRLLNDQVFRVEIALAGQKFVLENLSVAAIGKRYATRLAEISKMRAPMLAAATPADDKIVGCIDAPTVAQCEKICDTIIVEGWIASIQGIEAVEIYVDTNLIGQAHYGIMRADILSAYPKMHNAARSGFSCQIGTTELDTGQHTLKVIARSRSGRAKQWDREFTLENSSRYEKWLQSSESAYAHILPAMNNLFTILIKIDRGDDRALLKQTLQSLAMQTHQKFEIIVCVAATESREITSLFEASGLTGGVVIAENWGKQLSGCAGQLAGVLEIGDVLVPWALTVFDEVFHTCPQLGLVYADEDCLLNGARCKPVFKPGWSPLFLASFNYIGRPWFARKSIMISAMSVAAATGEKDIDEHKLLNALGQYCDSVAHIPTVLVSRPENLQANPPFVETRIKSNNALVYPKVSIIIPTRLSNLDIVERCFAGLCKLTDYPDMEVIVVVNNVKDPASGDSYLTKWPFKVIYWDKPFNWSGINNLGVAHATGEYLLFMNDDVESLEKNWLKNMADLLVVEGVGVVGSRLEYPNKTIQHLGVNFVDYGGGARHLFRFCTGNEPGLQWIMKYPREVSAVTGACLLTTRACFAALEGFDEQLPLVSNDVDFCLRAIENGYSIMIQPDSALIHHEGISRAGMPEAEDVSRFWAKWEAFLRRGDFYTNPNIDATRDDWAINTAIKPPYACRISHRGKG